MRRGYDSTIQNIVEALDTQCHIQSYFEAGIPVWDPKLKPPNTQKC